MLAFAGISLFIATFSFFEYQAMAIEAGFSGNATLPSFSDAKAVQRTVGARGATTFMGAKVSCVDHILQWLNAQDPSSQVKGFSKQWDAVRHAGKLQKIRALFAREGDHQQY